MRGDRMRFVEGRRYLIDDGMEREMVYTGCAKGAGTKEHFLFRSAAGGYVVTWSRESLKDVFAREIRAQPARNARSIT